MDSLNNNPDFSPDSPAGPVAEAVPSSRPRPVVLLLLGGWGVAAKSAENPLSAARTPYFSRLLKDYPAALLKTGAKDLPSRYLTLGAGQELTEADGAPGQTLTAIIAGQGWRQLKIAETERFAALTNFFNGATEEKAVGEEWRIVSSEGSGSTSRPILALRRLVKEIIKAINEEEPFAFIAAAVPSLDLAAESGDFNLVKKTMEALDKGLKKITSAVSDRQGVLIITSGGGRAEKIVPLPAAPAALSGAVPAAPAGPILSDNPVPFLAVGEEFRGKIIDPAQAEAKGDLSRLAARGSLADIAPTVLKIFGLAAPRNMTGRALF